MKTIEKKKSYCETTLGAGVRGCSLKQVLRKFFTKITGKQLRRSLFLMKLQVYSKFFTGDCFSNLLELSMVFGPVKKSVKSSHRKCSVKKGVLINFANFTGKHLSWGFFLTKWQTPTQLCSCEYSCEYSLPGKVKKVHGNSFTVKGIWYSVKY